MMQSMGMFFPLFWDPTMVLVLPGLLLAMWAQFRVQAAYREWSQVFAKKGVTGADVARTITAGQCAVQEVPGELTDHFDPRTNSLHLSSGVFRSDSVAALGIAAHEAGHALQHREGYFPLALRASLVPVANIGSWLAFPLFFIGMIIHQGWLIQVGMLLFTGALVFSLVTLPVEFDASSRALRILESSGILAPDEMVGARKVLRAAALTYIASTAMAALELLRMFILSSGRRS